MNAINRRSLLKTSAAAGAAAGLATLADANPFTAAPAHAAGHSAGIAPTTSEFGSVYITKSSPLIGTAKFPWDSYGDWGEQRCVPRDSSSLFGTYDYNQAYADAAAIGTIDLVQRYDKAEPDRIHNNAVHDKVPQKLSTKAILEQSFKGAAYYNKYSAKALGTWVVDIEMPDVPGIYVCALLWPTNNNTPGAEIDFLEGITRNDDWSSHLHWRNSDGSIGDEYKLFPGLNTTGKHRYRLDVAANSIQVWQDGTVIRTAAPSTHVPANVPMNLVVQTCFDYNYYGVGGKAGINWPVVADGPWNDPSQSLYNRNSVEFNSFSLNTVVKVTPIQIPN